MNNRAVVSPVDYWGNFVFPPECQPSAPATPSRPASPPPRRPVPYVVTAEERDPTTFPACRGRGGRGWDLFEYLRFMFCWHHCDHAVMDNRAALGDGLEWPWYCAKQGGRRIDFAFPTCPTPPTPEALTVINPRAPEWAAR